MRFLHFTLALALTFISLGCSAPDESTSEKHEPASCDHAGGQLFPDGAPWTTPIDDAPLDPQSAVIVDHLQTWHDSSSRFRIDFSLHVLSAEPGTPHRPFVPTEEFYEPDCDPAPVPLPAVGAVEGESDYECSANGDCHLLVVDRSACRLYEIWRANVTSAGFFGGCQAVWSLAKLYPASGRGEFCTSADAAGLPIAPLVFDAGEIASGEIRHALRFALPNTLIQKDVYVRPATHTTHAAEGSHYAPPYGARFRLRADFDLETLQPAAQIVARALQRYGMFLADGGKATFTAASDRFTSVKWADVGLEEHHLLGLAWSDFELVAGGQRIDARGECTRTPIVE